VPFSGGFNAHTMGLLASTEPAAPNKVNETASFSGVFNVAGNAMIFPRLKKNLLLN
jgi:hypothetical protein